MLRLAFKGRLYRNSTCGVVKPLNEASFTLYICTYLHCESLGPLSCAFSLNDYIMYVHVCNQTVTVLLVSEGPL